MVAPLEPPVLVSLSYLGGSVSFTVGGVALMWRGGELTFQMHAMRV